MTEATAHPQPLPPVRQWLIFTDLDGTLLDHHTYSHAAAQPVLAQLRALQVPVILNSSKTLAELASIAAELVLDSPLVAENGSVIHYPARQHTLTLGSNYAEICAQLDELRTREHYRFAGFHDWPAEQIAALTGLPLAAAALAAQRCASEPLLWQDAENRLEPFHQQLISAGLSLKRGGRFWHVMGQTDKVQAMHHLAAEYQQQWGAKPFVIALGDGPNDADMLAAADVAVIVYNPDGTPPTLAENLTQQRTHTSLPGPAGWAEAMSMLLANSAA
ncbi:MAG: HAD-IIB family hydrolase [Thiothrix sp.]